MSDAGSQGSGRGNGPPPARGRGLGGRRGGATGIVGGRGIPLVGGRGNQGLGRANPLGNHLVAGQGNQGVGRANPVVNGVGNVGPMGGGNGVFVGVGNIWAVGRGNGAAAVGNGVLGGVGNVEAAAVGNGGVAAVENGGAATVGNGGAAGRGNIGAVGRGNGRAGGRGRGRGFGRGALPNNNSIDALLASEARFLMPVLHPQRLNGALWFGTDNAPRQAIVAAIRRHFDGPWFNISSVPNETIIQWWGEFIQAFYWEPAYGAMVYNFWHNITAARLRGMVSTAKGNNQRPVWISLDIWNAMWAYWNTERAQNRSRIAAENRMSNRDGLGPHAHTSGARSFNQVRDLIRQREGAEPSMLRVLRETHRRPDGTYADGRAEYIDQEIQRQLEQSAQRQAEEAPLGSETASGTGGSALTQPDEDELFWQLVEPSQSGRVFGVGGQQPIRERGESSTMAASRVTLERQVQVLEQQLATVIQQMNRYLPSDGSEPNIPPTPRTQGAMGSGTGHVEPSTVNGDVAGEEEEDAAEGEEEEDPAEEDDGAFAAF